VERRSDRKLERRLRRVTCPALVVGAENDRLVRTRRPIATPRSCRTPRLQRIRGTGHAIVIEQPESTAQAILRFLETLR